MEIIGCLILVFCIYYTQKPTPVKKEARKKPDITVEIVFNRDK